jgi:SAM-dependent methyltransferase
LNRPLPFPDDTIDGVFASHVVEHMESFLQLMEELWRISKPGAWIHIWTPHFSSGTYTWSDPTHRRAFTSQTFELLRAGSVHYIHTRFLVRTLRLNLFTDGSCPPSVKLKHRLYIRLGRWIERGVNRTRDSQLRFERLWCQFFPFSEIYVELEVAKTA